MGAEPASAAGPGALQQGGRLVDGHHLGRREGVRQQCGDHSRPAADVEDPPNGAVPVQAGQPPRGLGDGVGPQVGLVLQVCGERVPVEVGGGAVTVAMAVVVLVLVCGHVVALRSWLTRSFPAQAGTAAPDARYRPRRRPRLAHGAHLHGQAATSRPPSASFVATSANRPGPGHAAVRRQYERAATTSATPYPANENIPTQEICSACPAVASAPVRICVTPVVHSVR